jgi:hypothetical protein
MGQGIVHFFGTMAKESTMDKMSAEEEKIQGFPHVFTFENFKKGLFGRHESSGGVGISIFVVPIAVVIVVVHLVSKERGAMQKAKR